MKKLLLLLFGLAAFLSCGSAHACTSSTPVTTVTGTNTNYATSDDGSGNCEAKFSLDQVGGSPVVGDPCQLNAHTFTPISINSASTTTAVAGTSSKNTYVCHIFIAPTAAAVNFTLVSGSGTNCGTAVHAALFGGTTAANGANLVANEGWTEGDGLSAVMATTTAGDNICLVPSAAQQISGVIVTVAQ